jgi:hypothetical protein
MVGQTDLVRSWGKGAAVTALTLLVLTGCTAAPTPTPAPSSSAPPSTPDIEAAAQVSEDFSPVVGEVLAEPAAFPATDGEVHIAYELLLSNVLSQDIALDSVSVLAGDETLLELDGSDILPWIRIYGGQAGSTTLGPGQRALVWLDVTVPTMADVPEQLAHRIQISPTEEIPPLVSTSMTQTIAATAVSQAEPVVISPPLRGERWLDGNSCCTTTPHRAAINPINGALHAPERYAIDYVQLDAEDRIFDGPRDDLSSYAYYGSEVVAVADGPVVAIVSDLPEQQPGANPSGLQVSEYGGNHVVQDIGGGHYAFYAHLQPDNPEGLEVGQQLSRGDAVGLLGNTGNTDGPHLHFHVMDSPLPLAANGVPFVFDDFEVEGFIDAETVEECDTVGGACEIDTAEAGPRQGEGPLSGDLMAYR